MGQYYLIVNQTKKEYLHPHKLDSGLKLLEIACCDLPRVLIMLLWKSTGGGGGDGNISDEPIKEYAGRWAGDQVVIVGDYDDGKLYEEAEDTYTDISFPVRWVYNFWMDIPEMQINDSWGYQKEWAEWLKANHPE